MLHPRIALCFLLLVACHAASSQTATPRIVGGSDAPPTRWPWMTQVAIKDPTLSSGYLLCGASQISTRWVLTAAHCLEYSNGAPAAPSNVYVFIGNTVRNNVPESGTQAEKLFVHSQYQNLEYDLALIQIPETSNTEWPSIITLATSNSLETAPFSERDEAVTALGWGETGSGLSATLQEVQLDYLPRSQCRNLSPLSIADFVICAAELNPVNGNNQDSCFGDSGGPLFLGRDPSPRLVGLTSFGEEECATGSPAGYTHLAAETDEIEALTAAAGLPLVDLALSWSGSPADRLYSLPADDVTLQIQVDSAENRATNPTLDVALSGRTTASAQWQGCNSTLPGNRCTPTPSLNGSLLQSLLISGNNGPDQVVTVTVQGRADEEEFRRQNNQLAQTVVFSSNPDITLGASQTLSSASQARVTVTLSNRSPFNNASNAEIRFNLPPSLTLTNREILGCTGTTPVLCPVGNVSADSVQTMSLDFASDDRQSRNLSLTGHIDESDVPNGDTSTSLTLSFNDPPASRSSGSSGSGGSLPATILLASLLLAIRRQSCPTC
ncbi:S1 family peptidase [Alcanivorax profundi]|nr:serine protease [Alcanivorax profundi]